MLFISTLKLIVILKKFKFLFWLRKVRFLIRKVRLISKFMMSQIGKQTIAVCILPIISRSKGNQTLRFGQLIEYNKSNIFLKKML